MPVNSVLGVMTQLHACRPGTGSVVVSPLHKQDKKASNNTTKKSDLLETNS